MSLTGKALEVVMALDRGDYTLWIETYSLEECWYSGVSRYYRNTPRWEVYEPKYSCEGELVALKSESSKEVIVVCEKHAAFLTRKALRIWERL